METTLTNGGGSRPLFVAMGEHTICDDADDVDAIFADLDDLISSLPDELDGERSANVG